MRCKCLVPMMTADAKSPGVAHRGEWGPGLLRWWRTQVWAGAGSDRDKYLMNAVGGARFSLSSRRGPAGGAGCSNLTCSMLPVNPRGHRRGRLPLPHRTLSRIGLGFCNWSCFACVPIPPGVSLPDHCQIDIHTIDVKGECGRQTAGGREWRDLSRWCWPEGSMGRQQRWRALSQTARVTS